MSSLYSIVYFFFFIASCTVLVRCGHEVLHGVNASQQFLVSPKDIAIVQFDNRPLGNYWNISARYNRAYAKKYGHKYLFLSQDSDCLLSNTVLAPSWCKVRAMIHAHDLLPSTKVFLYLDSDAVMTVNYSLSTIFTYIQDTLRWNTIDKPVAFNQDGPGWACKLAVKLGYRVCFNSGTIIWFRTSLAREILISWWLSSMDDLKKSKFRMNWRLRVSSTGLNTMYPSIIYLVILLSVALGTSPTVRYI
jgi:hypothetical protein